MVNQKWDISLYIFIKLLTEVTHFELVYYPIKRLKLSQVASDINIKVGESIYFFA